MLAGPAHKGAQNAAAQIGLHLGHSGGIDSTGRVVAQPLWYREHPLAHRQAREYVVRQVRGRLHHAPRVARGADAPALTGIDDGRRLYDYFVAQAKAAHMVVQTGIFAADMQVELMNDGPVTTPMRVVPAL
jgi:hypothetical protein